MKRKIRKYRGGGMDASKDDFKSNASAMSSGYQGAKASSKTVTQNKSNDGYRNRKKSINIFNRSPNNNTSSFMPRFNMPNFTFPTKGTLAVKVLTGVENARRKKRAKGEFFLTNKKIMPINRDFYRQYNRPLDTKIGSVDEPYMKEAGIIGFKKPIPEDKRSPVKCPDGTLPPCPPKLNKTKQQEVKPQQNFFNLQLNKGGGVPYGPPPKKGPNSQVPPVKFSRGGGSAIRGTKFKGVF